MNKFERGDIVRCIDDRDTGGYLRKGEVYEVEETYQHMTRLRSGIFNNSRFEKVAAAPCSNTCRKHIEALQKFADDVLERERVMKRQLELAESYNFDRLDLADDIALLDLYNYVLLALGKPKVKQVPRSLNTLLGRLTAELQDARQGRAWWPSDLVHFKAEPLCPDKLEPAHPDHNPED
jgi:hypothetical protein